MRIRTMRNLLLGSVLGVSAMVSTSAGATVILEDTGWQYDQVNTVGGTSQSSPWTFTVNILDTPGVFSLSDGFKHGDTYTVTVNGGLPMVSTLGAPAATNFDTVPNNFGPAATDFAADFLDPTFSHLQVFLGAGAYSIVVTGDGGGGIPAGVGVRLDSLGVPEPMTLSLFGAGLAGLGAMRRRKKKSA